LLADVGLVGFPNAGKSTLISRISAARPKIADYPFTTLEPNLGVVDAGDGRTFVVADIPGLIEGAHQGSGLGIQFLRHVERTHLLVHLVDVSEATGRDPVNDFEVIMRELASFSPEMAAKPMLLVAAKIDVAQDSARVEALENWRPREPGILQAFKRHRAGRRSAEAPHGRHLPCAAGASLRVSRDSSVYCKLVH
jgi:GTP-binding protein